MKILLFEPFLIKGENLGGDAKKLVQLAEDLEKQGHSYEIITENVGPMSSWQNYHIIKSIFKYKKGDYTGDVILSSGTPFWGALTGLVRKKLGIPAIFYLTHINYPKSNFYNVLKLNFFNIIYPSKNFFRNIDNTLFEVFHAVFDGLKTKKFFLKKLNYVDKVIASCEYLKNYIKPVYNKKVQICYPGIKEIPEKDLPENKLDDEVKFLYFGALDLRRGPLKIINIARKLKSSKFKILAWPEYFPATKDLIKRIIKRYQIRNVELLGYCDDFPGEFAKVNFVLLPYLYTNYMPPLVLLEAMSMRRPIITTDVGANSEFITDQESGFIIDTKNTNKQSQQIQKIIKNNNTEKLTRIADRAAEIVKDKCDWQKFSNNFKYEIEKIVSTK